MASFHQVSFALAIILSSLVTMLCFMPPLWRPQTYVNSNVAGVRRALVIIVGLLHASLSLGTDRVAPFCPNPDSLNAKLFEWNSYTAACLFLAIFVAGPVRLSAVSTLGDDFLDAFTPPDTLITTGIYRYIQHPGYTGQVLILAVNLALLFRWDGAIGCFIPGTLLKDVQGWGFITCCVVILAMVKGLPQHVKIEETILKNAFGKKWERWHGSTKRFIPGVF
ncbi:hypothetical protein HJFPF1_05472 [Paramyrothecium foliicola]|nr:hypothetical protein HJFPF1_05472 [Paramyrothecium foliicola]